MSEAKKLRISEIRQNLFVVEELFYDKWFPLNVDGVVVNGTDKKVYVSIEYAEDAANSFLVYPRVVKEVVADVPREEVSNESYNNLDDPI
jgi:hypothetical protein